MITGIPASAGSLFIALITAMPSTSGMRESSSTRSTFSARIRAIASAPPSALMGR
jgi:hypothetical protein